MDSSNAVTVTEPADLVITIDSTDGATCFPGNDGSIYTTVTGGVGGYSFNWNSTPPQTTEDLISVDGGTYQFTVVDGNGCQEQTFAQIGLPPLPSVSLVSSTPDFCNTAQGSAVVEAFFGTPPYSFSWNTGFQNTSR